MFLGSYTRWQIGHLWRLTLSGSMMYMYVFCKYHQDSQRSTCRWSLVCLETHAFFNHFFYPAWAATMWEYMEIFSCPHVSSFLFIQHFTTAGNQLISVSIFESFPLLVPAKLMAVCFKISQRATTLLLSSILHPRVRFYLFSCRRRLTLIMLLRLCFLPWRLAKPLESRWQWDKRYFQVSDLFLLSGCV